MKIDLVIKKLEKIKKEEGNVDVIIESWDHNFSGEDFIEDVYFKKTTSVGLIVKKRAVIKGGM